MAVTMADVVKQHCRFFTQAGRDYFECKLCKAGGRDEPLLGKTALDQAAAHFDKVAAHFHTVAFVVPPEARRDKLFKWMKDEMAIYSMGENAAYVGSEIANAFFASELADRDTKINRLESELATLKENHGS